MTSRIRGRRLIHYWAKGIKGSSSVIEEFMVNADDISDPDLILNAWNVCCKFFSDIGCKLQENIPVANQL